MTARGVRQGAAAVVLAGSLAAIVLVGWWMSRDPARWEGASAEERVRTLLVDPAFADLPVAERRSRLRGLAAELRSAGVTLEMTAEAGMDPAARRALSAFLTDFSDAYARRYVEAGARERAAVADAFVDDSTALLGELYGVPAVVTRGVASALGQSMRDAAAADGTASAAGRAAAARQVRLAEWFMLTAEADGSLERQARVSRLLMAAADRLAGRGEGP